MIGDSDEKISFPHQLVLTNSQVVTLRTIFANKSSTDIKLSKTQISKKNTIQEDFLVDLLVHYLNRIAIKNVIKP